MGMEYVLLIGMALNTKIPKTNKHNQKLAQFKKRKQ